MSWDVYEPGKAENPAKSEGYFEIANFACAHACARCAYWEKRGYSNTADPWKEERYA